MRSLKTIIGVIIIAAIIISGNRVYSMASDSEKFHEAARSISLYMTSATRSHVDWDALAATGGSFSSGAQHSEYAKSLEGTRVYISGFGIPLDRGRFKVASMHSLPGMILESMVGAKEKLVYNYQTRFLFSPLPTSVYIGGNPPIDQTIFVRMAKGEMMDFEPEVATYISGVLELHSEPNQFYYVLRDAKKEEIALDE